MGGRAEEATLSVLDLLPSLPALLGAPGNLPSRLPIFLQNPSPPAGPTIPASAVAHPGLSLCCCWCIRQQQQQQQTRSPDSSCSSPGGLAAQQLLASEPTTRGFTPDSGANSDTRGGTPIAPELNTPATHSGGRPTTGLIITAGREKSGRNFKQRRGCYVCSSLDQGLSRVKHPKAPFQSFTCLKPPFTSADNLFLLIQKSWKKTSKNNNMQFEIIKHSA